MDVKTALADLTAQVKATTDAEKSAVLVINGIAQRIADAAGDPVAIEALVTELKSSADTLGAAVVANQEPAPPPPPLPTA